MATARLTERAIRAASYGYRQNIPGLEFDRFGRMLGLRLLRKHRRSAWSSLLHPVSIVRYFEFPFVRSCLPAGMVRCLDVSSPRLFSLFAASKTPSAHIDVINPDPADIAETRRAVDAMGLSNIRLEVTAADDVLPKAGHYDCIWSISVIEHIFGEHDDTWTVRRMYESLRGGGRLIVTVPVDREGWDEYRDRPQYGAQEPAEDGRYFFQRYYDADTLRARLVDAIGQTPSLVRWFGEKTRGHFAEYERRWMREGLKCVVQDPREIADHYGEFPSWESMPGLGVCGLMFERPR